MYYSNDYLCHYGVLGMKWGQHLFGKSGSTGSGRKSRTNKGQSSKNSTTERIKRGAKAAGKWTYDHRKQILGVSVAIIATAAASPYIAMGARAAGSAISSLMDQSASSVPKNTVTLANDGTKSTLKYDSNGKLVTSVNSSSGKTNSIADALTKDQKRVSDAYNAGKVSKEYYEEYMSNTKKNNYFGYGS